MSEAGQRLVAVLWLSRAHAWDGEVCYRCGKPVKYENRQNRGWLDDASHTSVCPGASEALLAAVRS
jgi:hypothetical protein